MKNKSITEIAEILSENNSAKLIYDFFQQILTDDEIDEISKRWELVKLLYKGESQRTISKKLKISLCKITRGSKELKKRNTALLKLVKLSK